jgi:hypothetical protein
MRLDSLRRCKPDQVRGSAGDRTLSALDPHADAEALPCRVHHDTAVCAAGVRGSVREFFARARCGATVCVGKVAPPARAMWVRRPMNSR